jgi:hypothetical protein
MSTQQETFRTTSDASEIAAMAAEAKGRLAKIYFGRSGRLSNKWRHYLAIYDRYLRDYCATKPRIEKLHRDGPLRFLEIGVDDGGSFEMWREYFGAEATIFGIDILPECREKVEAMGINCHIRIGSQDDPEFLGQVVGEMGGVDVVIDDGSHIANHQLASFKALFPRLSLGGLYICEDLHTSYWQHWGGGYKRPGTFVETVKDMIDNMHQWYYPVDNDLSSMSLHRLVTGIHVHDSIVVIEKEENRQPVMITA